MRWLRSDNGVVVHAPAKINLFFEVLGKRSDGYHEVETLMTPIDLYDTIYFRGTPNGQIDFGCATAPDSWALPTPWSGDVPNGPTNLVVRAVELLRRRAGVVFGAEIRLTKRIPTAAGLGGGSSDAAAALLAANRCWQLGWSTDQLANVAAELGSDVPFFLTDGAAICRGRGERIEPVEAAGALHVVLVRPSEGLSTAQVYGACRVPEAPKSIGLLVEAFRRGNGAGVAGTMFNRLEAAAELCTPWIARLRGWFDRLGLWGHGMSGSGTSYFGICRHAVHARQAAGYLRGLGAQSVFVVRTCQG